LGKYLYLGHAKIIKYCNRPFMTSEEQRQARLNPRSKHLHISDETVERHDAALIDAINALVGEDDELWILGDFCWGEYAQANLYCKRIHCQLDLAATLPVGSLGRQGESQLASPRTRAWTLRDASPA
jgi:calcineurin-like phosphoesterase family protein